MAEDGKVRRRPLSKTAQREQKVLKLRAKGLGFDDIAAQCGYANRGSAYKAYKRALENTGEQMLSDAQWRELELHRLELMHKAIWPQAARGDLAAVREAKRLHDARARLMGLTIAPGRLGGSTATDEGDDEGVVVGRDKLDELRERRARDASQRTPGS